MDRNEADVVISARPKGKKCRHLIKTLGNKQSDVGDFAKNLAIELISLKINEGVGSFYE